MLNGRLAHLGYDRPQDGQRPTPPYCGSDRRFVSVLRRIVSRWPRILMGVAAIGITVLWQMYRHNKRGKEDGKGGRGKGGKGGKGGKYGDIGDTMDKYGEMGMMRRGASLGGGYDRGGRGGRGDHGDFGSSHDRLHRSAYGGGGGFGDDSD